MAARLTASDLTGTAVLAVDVRLAGPRTRGVAAELIPDGAIPRGDAVGVVESALAGKALLLWDREEITRLRMLAGPDGRTRSELDCHEMAYTAASWRGDVDPRHGSLVSCLHPGSAPRLLHLLRRIADIDA